MLAVRFGSMKSQFKGRRQRARYALIWQANWLPGVAIKPCAATATGAVTDTGTVQIARHWVTRRAGRAVYS
jgi:hypothetical protein